MHTRMMSLVAVPFVAASLSFAGAAPASAQGPVNVLISETAAGLIAVDLNIQDVTILENVVVQAPIGIAANVCPAVNAAVLAQEVQQHGEADCEAETTTRAFSRLVQRQLDL